ncbi:MAG: ABC transporter ATP-binding protein [Lachnospiraceae bacterium]|nr:ABC transporter ATP-binding protein [Lachnospiraceae bacterium]
MLEVKELTKKYGNNKAIDKLTFTIEEGQIYGFLGPNGAGKSTTMNIISGYLASSSGSVTINGFDILKDAGKAKSQIGYLPEIPPVYPDMTVREYLVFAAELKKLKKAEIKTQVEEIMENLGLKDVSERLIKNLSKGYRQRTGLAQAIIGYPPIIILDEPTVGLDPLQIIEIRALIKKLGEKHTVILSSHILQEISAVCDHIMIISHGRLVGQGTPEELEKSVKGENDTFITVKSDGERVCDLLKNIKGVTEAELTAGENDEFSIHVKSDNGEDVREEIFTTLKNSGVCVLEMHTRQMKLEDVYLKLTSDEYLEELDRQDAADATEKDAAVQDDMTENKPEKDPDEAVNKEESGLVKDEDTNLDKEVDE